MCSMCGSDRNRQQKVRIRAAHSTVAIAAARTSKALLACTWWRQMTVTDGSGVLLVMQHMLLYINHQGPPARAHYYAVCGPCM